AIHGYFWISPEFTGLNVSAIQSVAVISCLLDLLQSDGIAAWDRSFLALRTEVRTTNGFLLSVSAF
ncbi:hypothetical protein QT970_31890, partial [Microcoleus sp. herbarium8]|uniref:hypothetical protein n=1 Tax=Microcoleus sp. herbarium8 TaxID=3055436 RepID=UPI002FD3E37D